MKLYKEDGTMFDSDKFEVVEQALANSYIDEDDVVLELGARYGSVSIMTNKKLKNKTSHVVVEPDETVWEALERNKKLYECEFDIIKGCISEKESASIVNDGYGTKITDGHGVKCVSLHSLDTIKFDTLVADCEGSLTQFFDDYPHMYSHLKKIIMEEDGDYSIIKKNLLRHGFIKIFEHTYPWVSDVYPYYIMASVWVKVSTFPVNHTLQHIHVPTFSTIF